MLQNNCGAVEYLEKHFSENSTSSSGRPLYGCCFVCASMRDITDGVCEGGGWGWGWLRNQARHQAKTNLPSQAEIIRGVPPDESWARVKDNLLEVTILQLVGMSLESYKDGGLSSDLVIDDLREFIALFNGNWREDTVQHYCYKVNRAGSPSTCCSSAEQTKSKMRACAKKVIVPLFGRAGAGKTKKWVETSRSCCITGFFRKCHNFMRNASRPWHGNGNM